MVLMRRFFPVMLIAAALWMLCGIALADTSGDFEYYVQGDGTAKVTDYTGDETDLVIPETIDGYTVTALSRISVPRIENLTSITIPNSLTVIDQDALTIALELKEIRIADDHPTLAYQDGVLYNKERTRILRYLSCNTAEHFDIPDGIEVIEDSAFYGAQFVSITIPASVKKIDHEAFQACKSLESVYIPAGVTEIGEGCFDYCKNLTEILVAPENPVFAVIDGALINMQDCILIAYALNCDAETYAIPDFIIRIGNDAFGSAKNLKHVVFPDGLLEIGKMAFDNCRNLMEADLPDGLTLIDTMAFYGCDSLAYIRIPSSITKLQGHFYEGDKDFFMKVDAGSYAEQWCRENRVDYVVIPSEETMNAEAPTFLLRMDGGSMNDTILDRQILTVESRDAADLLRFDIVVVNYPDQGDAMFVKRLVGLPGDTVELQGGYLYVNGEKYDEPYIPDEYRQGLSNDYSPCVVPEGCYFVLGDRRNNSKDSRYIRAIPADMMIGVVTEIDGMPVVNPLEEVLP